MLSDPRDICLSITSFSSILGCLIVLWRFHHTNKKPVSLKMIAVLTVSDLSSCLSFFVWALAYGFTTTNTNPIAQVFMGVFMEFSIIWSCNIAHFVYKSLQGDKISEANQLLTKRLAFSIGFALALAIM